MNISVDFKKQQLQDTINHVSYVLQGIHKLCNHLFETGQDELALAILKRGLTHDASKANYDEFMGLAANVDDKSALTNINVKYPKMEQLDIIKLHWYRNPHHPEYYADIQNLNLESQINVSEQMKKEDILEMCIDWYSRSLQYNSNVFDFYNIKKKTRWLFTAEQQQLIEETLIILTKKTH